MHKLLKFNTIRTSVGLIKFRSKGTLPEVRSMDDVELVGKKGAILGVYYSDKDPFKLSPAAKDFDARNNNIFCEFLEGINSPLRLGQSCTFTHLDPDFFNVCLVGVGRDGAGYNRMEELDECKENVRVAIGIGVRKLRETGVSCLLVDPLADVGAAAEGANLAAWRYQEYRAVEGHVPIPNLDLFGEGDREEWERGIIKSSAQNIARQLSDCPANCMTPSIFCQTVGEILCPCGVEIEVRDEDWMEAKRMHGILAASKGSCERPALLEIGYCGGSIDDKPVLLVGKGATFNSGGLCLMDPKGLDIMRADMSGAAVVAAVIKAAASLSLPLNIRGVIPLYENMPSGMAVKPGDMIHSMAGKTILVQDTGREGELAVADAITYGQSEFKPKLIIDIATLSRGTRHCLGAGATGVFCNSDEAWEELQKAGSITGDRMWRLPLWDHYSEKVTTFPDCDLHNVGLGKGGSACLSAAFLQEFVECTDWIHMDTAGTGMQSHGDEFPYLTKGRMTGRPTRSVLQFLYQLACGGEVTDPESEE